MITDVNSLPRGFSSTPLIVLFSQLPLTLCDPMDCIVCQAPLSMEFFQARILEWVAIPFSRAPSASRD